MASSAQAAPDALNVAVITSPNDVEKKRIFKNEITALLEGEYEVDFTEYPTSTAGDYALAAEQMLRLAYADDRIDVVLVLDPAANQALGRYSVFNKPTFLPFVIKAELAGYPENNGTSGKTNLSYLSRKIDFGNEIRRLKSVAEFRKAVLIGDARVQKKIDPAVIDALTKEAAKAGVVLTVQGFDGDVGKALGALPDGIEAVLYGSMTSVSRDTVSRLIAEINRLRIPSFSLVDEQYVELGALATDSPAGDWQRVARRVSLNIGEVLQGKAAAKLPVEYTQSNRLIINMATSRQIRVAPPFDVLSEARLLNEMPRTANRHYSLEEVARVAVRENLSLSIQRIEVERANESVKEVRSALLPRITASVQQFQRRADTAAVRSGIFPEQSSTGALSFSVPLYSERLWAAYTIEKFSALSEAELEREIELDITQAAVNAYLNVLFEKTSLEIERYNLDVTRENYRLAKNRVEVGAETAADLYRWESELANAKQVVLNAKASYEQQKYRLNQVLNRPIDEEFTTAVESLNNPSLLISDPKITDLIQNTYGFEEMARFFAEVGLKRSPELKRLEADLAASERLLTSNRRAYWWPDLALTAQVTDTFDENRSIGGLSGEGGDWQIGLELSLPLFEGGARYARTAQSRLAVEQVIDGMRDERNRIEEGIRNQLESTRASFRSIPLAEQSESAAQKNYNLINESYRQGARSITDVLDAQESLISARQASMNAVYAFLIDLMNLQRTLGAFDFFLTDSERTSFVDELGQRVEAASGRQGSNNEKGSL